MILRPHEDLNSAAEDISMVLSEPSHLDYLWAQPDLQQQLLSAIHFQLATVSKLWNSGQ